jgi:hypothetical protein
MKRRLNLHGAALADALKDFGKLYIQFWLAQIVPILMLKPQETRATIVTKGIAVNTILWISISGPLC